MYPNNNLHQKLAVSEILNNVSLSLSFWGPYSYIMCTLFFFGWMYYVYQWMKEGKLSTKLEFFYILYSST